MSAEPGARGHGFEGKLPLPYGRREGIALCLSGGGYRAALFHVGALRRLNELGVLSKVDTISSVSGGSIMNAQIAGHVAENPDAWGEPGDPVAGFEDGIVRPIEELSTQDIRTKAVLTRLKPWNWFDQNSQIDVLASRLAEGPAKARIADLPARPRFVFCATDVCFRDQWTVDSETKKVGSDFAGHAPAGDRWTIARAAAASSCLPGAFAPMRVDDMFEEGEYAGADRAELLRKVDLTDGGVYDNLGLEPVWRTHKTVLVSDAAPAFRPDPHIGRLWSQLRYAVTLLEQATDVRKRWLIASFLREHERELEGAYWGIASKPRNYGFDPGVGVYSEGFIGGVISQIRIDLDPFSDEERAVLENQGYLLADIAIRKHQPGLVATPTPPRVPYDQMDEQKLERALRDSHLTKAFKRGLRALR
jgi:NTE family protein